MSTPPNAPLDLRPMSIGELLDRTFSLYRNDFWLWIGIAAIPYLIMFGVKLTSTYMVRTGGSAGAVAGLGVMGIGFLAFWLLNMVAQGAVVSAVSQLYTGRSSNVNASYNAAFSRFGAVLAIALLSGMAIGVGTILCIIPGIIMAILFALSLPALLVEKSDVGRAIERSFALGKEAWPTILLIYVLFTVVNFGLVMLLSMPFSLLMLWDPSHAMGWTTAQALGEFLVGTAVSPLLNIAMTLVYFDQRIRREGFDLQMMIAALDVAGQPLPATPPPAV